MIATKLMRRAVAATLAIATVSMAYTTVTSASTAPRGQSASPQGDCGWVDPAGVAGLHVHEAADELDELSTFSAAVAASSLDDQLAGEGPFTIFAPSNDAFSRIPTNVFDAILADAALLDEILSAHVVIGQALPTDQLAAAGAVDTLNGNVTVMTHGDALMLNDGEARVTCAGISTANATIYVIDQVLQPAGDSMCPSDSSVPGSSVPGSSVPMASVPDSSVPGASVPGSSVPC